MPKPDAAHLQTDKELAKLEKRIAKIYKEAADDLQKTIDDYFAKFDKRDAKQKARLEAGEITEQEYKQWRLAQMGRGERFKALQSRVAERYTEANKTAVRYVNDATPGIYSLNRNYSAYTIEKAAGNIGFDLWDEQTVKRLIVDNPELMPYYPPEKALNRGIDLAYGKRQISASVTSSILQGKSITGIAKDLQTRMPDMNKASAVRTARTAVTGAQNAGRMDSYVAAEKMGIKVRKEWLATIDGRTRHSHAMLDGKVVDKDKKFGNGCMFPGDPNGPAAEVYNCRCALIAAVDGVDTSNAQRRVRNPETGKNEIVSDMTYQEWAGLKEKAQVKKAMAEKPLYDIMGVSERNVDISALPKETQELVESSVRRSIEKFPQLKGHFTKIEYDESIDAIASSYSITGSVKLSKKFKDYQKLQKEYDYDVRLRWHPKGTTAQSTITHEIGHQLDGLLTKKGIYGGSVSQYGITRTSVAVQKEVLSRIGLSDERLREIRKQYSDMGYKGKDLNHAVQFERKEFIEKHICSYAAENSNEFFACLYAEYMDSPEPREAATIFGEILERIMGEIK